MTPTQVLADADIRLEWANKHVKRFEAEIQAFHATENYRVVPHGDPQNPDLMRVTDPPAIPPQLNLIASDALHNMRVALDYLAGTLALLNGRTMTSVYFPIAASGDEYRAAETQRKIKKLAPNAKAFIDGLQPYKGGNDRLWALNEVEKVDKHRNLILFDEASPMWYFTPRASDSDEPWDATKGGQQYNYRITLVPGFADLEGFEGQSALTLLKEFLSSVADALRDARRLFFPNTQSAVVFPPS